MKKYRFFYMPLIVLLSLSGCIFTPVEAVSIETIAAATYAVIQAQTAAAMPIATLVPPTLTELRSTLTPYPTSTTFVILSPTPTLTSTATPAYTATNATSGSGTILYACDVLSTSPESVYVVKPNEKFKWTLNVKNTGTAKWWPDSTYIKYSHGAEYYVDKESAIERPTDPEETGIFIVKMQAPKGPGTYTTTWSMRKGIHYFCYVQLRIVVKK